MGDLEIPYEEIIDDLRENLHPGTIVDLRMYKDRHNGNGTILVPKGIIKGKILAATIDKGYEFWAPNKAPWIIKKFVEKNRAKSKRMEETITYINNPRYENF